MATFPAVNHATDSLRTIGEFQADFEAMLAATKQIPGAAVAELAITISGGSITPAGGGGVLVVDTESAAATDDLTNILTTNYPDGACVLLRNANAARSVVMKHAATGAGQLFLSRNADYVMDDTKKFILVQLRVTDWYEIYRSPARLEMPVVTKSSSFTVGKEHHGCMILCTGAGMAANLPAAATLGNGFTVAIINGLISDNTITIDPAGSETLNAFGLWTLYRSEGVLLVCDGSNFYSPGGLTRRRLYATNYGTTVFVSPQASEYNEVGILTGNVTTVDMGNPLVGQHVRIRFQQDGTGGRTVAVPAGAKVSGSLASAANQASVLDLTYSGTALRWEGFWTQIPL